MFLKNDWQQGRQEKLRITQCVGATVRKVTGKGLRICCAKLSQLYPPGWPCCVWKREEVLKGIRHRQRACTEPCTSGR